MRLLLQRCVAAQALQVVAVVGAVGFLVRDADFRALERRGEPLGQVGDGQRGPRIRDRSAPLLDGFQEAGDRMVGEVQVVVNQQAREAAHVAQIVDRLHAAARRAEHFLLVLPQGAAVDLHVARGALERGDRASGTEEVGVHHAVKLASVCRARPGLQAADFVLELQPLRLPAVGAVVEGGFLLAEHLFAGHQPGGLLLGFVALRGGPLVELPLLLHQLVVLRRHLPAETLQFGLLLLQLGGGQAIVVGQPAADAAQRMRERGGRSGPGKLYPQFLGGQADFQRLAVHAAQFAPQLLQCQAALVYVVGPPLQGLPLLLQFVERAAVFGRQLLPLRAGVFLGLAALAQELFAELFDLGAGVGQPRFRLVELLLPGSDRLGRPPQDGLARSQLLLGAGPLTVGLAGPRLDRLAAAFDIGGKLLKLGHGRLALLLELLPLVGQCRRGLLAFDFQLLRATPVAALPTPTAAAPIALPVVRLRTAAARSAVLADPPQAAGARIRVDCVRLPIVCGRLQVALWHG